MAKDKKPEFLNPDALEKALQQMRRDGKSIYSCQQILTHGLVADDAKLNAYRREIELTCKKFKNYDEVERIIVSDLCKELDGKKYFYFNPTTRERTAVEYSSLISMFSQEYLYKKLQHLLFIYDPKQRETLVQRNDRIVYNLYVPPEWRFEGFYSGKINPESELPAVFVDYITHLLDGDQDSIDYILRWMAYSLIERNRCYLVLIGSFGVGKGTLFEILKLLHGEQNAAEDSAEDYFGTNFNGGMYCKTLYSINEIPKLGKRETNSLKYLESSEIRIEMKNENAKKMLNTINLMLSSNDLDCLDIPPGERRYSIVTLTNKKLLDHWAGDFETKMALLKSPETIDKLGRYLLTQIPVNHETMKKDFKSTTKLAEINEQSLEDWQDYFLFDYCIKNAGQTISVTQVCDAVKQATAVPRHRLSRQTLRELARRFKVPGKKFYVETTVTEGDKHGASALKFSDVHEQPDKSLFNLKVVD